MSSTTTPIFNAEEIIKSLMAKSSTELAAVKSADVAPSFAQLESLVEVPSRAAGIAGTIAETQAPKLIGDALPHITALDNHAKTVKAIVDDSTKLEATIRGGESIGKTAMATVEHVEGVSTAVKDQFTAVKDGLVKQIEAAKATPDQITKAREALKAVETAETAALQHVGEAERAAAHYKPLITETTKAVETGIGKTVAAAEMGTAATAASTIGRTISSDAKKLGVIGKAAFESKDLGMFGRLKAKVNANWNISSIDAKTGKITEAGLVGKGMRVLGTGAGVVIGGYGLKDLGQVVGVVSPDIDEQGKEIPVDSGKLFKSVAELGASAGILYLSLVKGGAGKAMGQAI